LLDTLGPDHDPGGIGHNLGGLELCGAADPLCVGSGESGTIRSTLPDRPNLNATGSSEGLDDRTSVEGVHQAIPDTVAVVPGEAAHELIQNRSRIPRRGIPMRRHLLCNPTEFSGAF